MREPKQILASAFIKLAGIRPARFSNHGSVGDGKSIMLEEALARGGEKFVGRWGGPMTFRFLIQPAVAILFAVRAGLKDARQNVPPFLWAVLSDAGSRQKRLRQMRVQSSSLR